MPETILAKNFSSFSLSAQLRLPPAPSSNLALPEVYDLEIGKMWSHLLDHCPLEPDSTIVEVAPGMSPKVGMGLRMHHFRGTLYIVEPCKESLEKVTERYREVLPQATIIPLCCRLDQASEFIKGPVDGILANHPMDDMLLATLPIPDEKLQTFFVNNYVGPNPHRTSELWKTLKADPNFFAASQAKVITDWTSAIHDLNPKFVGIAQYRSYFFRSNGLTIPDEEALKVLRALAVQLGTSDVSRMLRTSDSPITESDRWLLLFP